MKKTLFSFMIAAMSFAACQEIEPTTPDGSAASERPAAEYLTLTGNIEQNDMTRTTMSAENKVLWSSGDCIATFLKSATLNKYQTADSDAGKNYSEFEYILSDGKVLGEDWDHIVAYYPYSADVTCAKAEDAYSLNVVLPATQTHSENSFGSGAFPMVAVSEDTDLRFRNVCGAIKLEFKGDVSIKDVKITGNNNEKLSGPAVVTARPDYGIPAISMTDDASTSVTMTCDDGWGEFQTITRGLVLGNQNTFIITLPPVEFTKGFKITVTDSQGRTYTINTNKPNTVLRSSLLVMPAIELPEKCDYIDEWGNNLGKGIEIDGTIWAPVNCGYHPTDFKYGKLYQWGRKYGQGYSDGTYSDAVLYDTANGPFTLSEGQAEEYENTYFQLAKQSDNPTSINNWLNQNNKQLWNSGTEEKPVKTQYDPCPAGWRVPTRAELTSLIANKSSMTTYNGLSGYWVSGSTAYSEDVNQIFLSEGGRHEGIENTISGAICTEREAKGYYWSSEANDSKWITGDSYYIICRNTGTSTVFESYGGRISACSVRCVQE